MKDTRICLRTQSTNSGEYRWTFTVCSPASGPNNVVLHAESLQRPTHAETIANAKRIMINPQLEWPAHTLLPSWVYQDLAFMLDAATPNETNCIGFDIRVDAQGTVEYFEGQCSHGDVMFMSRRSPPNWLSSRKAPDVDLLDLIPF